MGWFLDSVTTELTPQETITFQSLVGTTWTAFNTSATPIKASITQSRTGDRPAQSMVGQMGSPAGLHNLTDFQVIWDAFLDDPTLRPARANDQIVRQNGRPLIVVDTYDNPTLGQIAYCNRATRRV